MALVMDPAGEEIRALKRALHWRGRSILEVGCGNGRLTLRLAGLGAGKIIALDPDPTLIRSARRNLPDPYKKQISYRVGSAEHVKQKPDQFDVVIFSWVL